MVLEHVLPVHLLACACLHAQSLNPVRICQPMDCSSPGSSVHGILQARILECIAISSSIGSSWPRDRTLVSCIFCIDKQILYHRALREDPLHWHLYKTGCTFLHHKSVSAAEFHWTQVWFCNNCPCDTDAVWGSCGQFSSRCLASRILPDLDRSETPSPVSYIFR